MRELLYCHYCGHEMEYKLVENCYSETTGKQIKRKYCFNPLCENGCENVGGHEWGKLWKLQNWEKCQRCGYEVPTDF